MVEIKRSVISQTEREVFTLFLFMIHDFHWVLDHSSERTEGRSRKIHLEALLGLCVYSL